MHLVCELCLCTLSVHVVCALHRCTLSVHFICALHLCTSSVHFIFARCLCTLVASIREDSIGLLLTPIACTLVWAGCRMRRLMNTCGGSTGSRPTSPASLQAVTQAQQAYKPSKPTSPASPQAHFLVFLPCLSARERKEKANFDTDPQTIPNHLKARAPAHHRTNVDTRPKPSPENVLKMEPTL